MIRFLDRPTGKTHGQKTGISKKKGGGREEFSKKQSVFRDERTSISPVGRLGVIHER